MILHHCRARRHEYCGGYAQDRQDGSAVRCDCKCHTYTQDVKQVYAFLRDLDIHTSLGRI